MANPLALIQLCKKAAPARAAFFMHVTNYIWPTFLRSLLAVPIDRLPHTFMHSPNKNVYRAVLVAALGYFVDIYDLILFSIVRVDSLKSLGCTGIELERNGVLILNMQMLGMLLGGVFWGILGDKKGRLSVLFGSILLYSVANIANAFVQDVTQYALVRLVAGFGLAGELGAGITLVGELMSREKRGNGTTVVVTVGAAGAIFAGMLSQWVNWQTAYLVGGVLGLSLLALRIGIRESGMFQGVSARKEVRKGDFRLLLSDPLRARLFLHSILIGIPIWFCVGILITFSPELGRDLHLEAPVVPAMAVMCAYGGLVFGDFVSGIASQWFKTRKKVVRVFLFITLAGIVFYLYGGIQKLRDFYVLCFVLGSATGYWAVFVTMASEHFGTNFRSTATTSIPNFVRGSVLPITFLYTTLQGIVPRIESALITGLLCVGIALWSLSQLHETWGRDMDFVEGESK
jgi:MFS family permease